MRSRSPFNVCVLWALGFAVVAMLRLRQIGRDLWASLMRSFEPSTIPSNFPPDEGDGTE